MHESPTLPPPAASRTVIQAEAIGWLDANPAWPGSSVVTSLPDLSELPLLGFDGWKRWFVASARRVIRWVPDDGVAIFFQSDVRHEGEWVDKGYLLMRAAEEEQAILLWHKIVCRRPPGTVAQGRPSYSRMLCFSRVRRPVPLRPGPDVLADAGAMSWSRAMGENACRVACRFLREETSTRIVVDPFCGVGSVLAVANLQGFAAVGVDLSRRRCRAAQKLGVLPATTSLSLPLLLLVACALGLASACGSDAGKPAASAAQPAPAAAPATPLPPDGKRDDTPASQRLDQELDAIAALCRNATTPDGDCQAPTAALCHAMRNTGRACFDVSSTDSVCADLQAQVEHRLLERDAVERVREVVASFCGASCEVKRTGHSWVELERGLDSTSLCKGAR